MSKKQVKRNILFEYREETFVSSLCKRPETLLPIAFFLLCLVGSILLFLPISKNTDIAFLDNLFVAVSAGCVTGLSVLNVGQDYSTLGQIILMLLIQSGGLGIMSITSIIFIILGKRMSLSQERNARKILDVESHEEIKTSLHLIFKYTFMVEAIGAFVFLIEFLIQKMTFLDALKNAMFLSVSAFCNAGFMLNDIGMIEYGGNPVVVYTVTALAFLGAISPAISILLPKWLRREKLSPQAVLVINTTMYLVVFGAIFFFCSEGFDLLKDYPLIDRINQSIFQSVVTRTAGFSTVDFSQITPGTYILILFLMFVGGSPGGTAGGVKSCTFGVLVVTAYNLLRGRENIIRNKNITFETVQKAITLIFLYFIILTVVILALLTTQTIEAHKLIFEATSALGTVGLSMGITPQLDEVGKVIIIITMFIGRVAPTTFLCYLNSKNCDTNLSYPDAKLTLT